MFFSQRHELGTCHELGPCRICDVGGSGGGGYRFVVIITEKELVYRALLGDLLSPTQKAKLGAGDTAALRRFELESGPVPTSR